MKQSSRLIALYSILGLSALSATSITAQSNKIIRHVTNVTDRIVPEESRSLLPPLDPEKLRVRSVDEIINSLDTPDFSSTPVNKILGPWVFSGYRNIRHKRFDPSVPTTIEGLTVMTNDSIAEDPEYLFDDQEMAWDMEEHADPLTPEMTEWYILDKQKTPDPDIVFLHPDATPRWLRNALTAYRIQEDFMYNTMIDDPATIDYAYWDLPEPPRLPEDDISFNAFIKKMNLPSVETDKAVLPEEVKRRIHWLHGVNASMQFSQAYVSSNWYQGGNNHLAMLFNVNWNVQLNQVYHPNLLFQSNLQYKLGLNSTPQDEVHAYSISEDVLQWNLNTGLKAFKKWFYSFNLQFKTQIFKNYENNSMKRKSSFLSPGDFNLGLGMSYSISKPKWQLTATLSPVSYNLKTCITDKIDHNKFNIKPNRKTHSEIGSNGEVNLTWKIAWNIDYKTRLFLFSDYDYFLADWEHTINFSVNKFLSTQLYFHFREDTSTDTNTKWKHFMMREVLSFGLSYTFSTK